MTQPETRTAETGPQNTHNLIAHSLNAMLYGRSRESHALSMAFRRAAAGGAELVVLSGPAGIGKTTLVRHMRSLIGELRGYFISGKFDQLQRDVPFSAIVMALHDLVRQLLTDSQQQQRAWRDAIVGAVGRNGRVITEVVPALEQIIGPQPPLAPLEPTESQNRFNHVFQCFLQVFCRENRPLVVFLDDMQWADPASPRMLTSLLSGAGTHSLLVVASCRDNEVVATHPFMLAIKELERRAVPVHTLQLAPLGWSDITQFIGDEMKLDPDAVAPLAELVREKTGGNPFFMRQFLQKLQAEGLLDSGSSSGRFRCDLEAIRTLAVSENVADLIAQKLDRLDAETRRIVSFGAAIGNRFDLGTLANVAGCTAGRAGELLAAAVRANLLSSVDGASTAANTAGYIFVHDRVQQAAYALVPASSRPSLNLNIGRAMLAAAGDDLSNHVFEIVNHMNQGIALLDSRADRLRLAKLNMQAATRARDSTAYDLATRACRSTIELLGWDAWGENYALAFEAHLRLAESQALIADFEGALATIDEALISARSAVDKARLITVRTHTYLSMCDMTGAVASGRQAVQLFGLDLPDDPDQVRARLQGEVGWIIGWSAEHPIESLLDLPQMTDPDQMALMSLLMHMIPPAYQVNPELFALICCHMVRLSIEHGNCPMSAKGYGSLAPILSGIVGNFRDGDRFGKLGVDLCEKLNDITVRSSCHFTWAAFASAWVRPVEESIKEFREGARWGMASGDHPHAGYCSAIGITHIMYSGAKLQTVLSEMDEALKLLNRIRDVTSLAVVNTRYRFADWLRTDTGGSTLDDAHFSEARMLGELQASSGSKSMLAQFQVQRLMCRFFAGQYGEAWRISKMLDDLLVYVPGMLTTVEHAFFQCLSITQYWEQAPAAEREVMAARLESQLSTMGTWAQNCAANFTAVHLTVAAERARVLGEHDVATRLFDRAIAAARDSRFPHFEAIACELAMSHARGRDAARAESLRACAIAAYEAWGAVRKVNVVRAAR